MGTRTAYAPGTFCWVDLGTTDLPVATAFYGGLLGWESEEIAGGYLMQRRRGLNVAGIYASELGGPGGDRSPAWLSYVAVDDADAAAGRAADLGGTPMMGPFDVLQHGRTGLLADPQGAVLGVWQAREHIGAELVNEVGALSLNQLNTTDPAGASAFYTALFGWEIAPVAPEPQPYWGITNRGALNGGMTALDPYSPAPHWLAYFTAADLDAAGTTIAGTGGAVLVPPLAIPSGRILVAQDPRGARFALFEGDVDP
jgi:predicted enzyme related to lactoylglutathione lyase